MNSNAAAIPCRFFLGHCGNTLIVATRSLCTIRAKDGALSSAVVRLILRLFECFHRSDSQSLPKDIRTRLEAAALGPRGMKIELLSLI